MNRENVEWSEDFEFPGHYRTIEFNADSYNDWVDTFFSLDQIPRDIPAYQDIMEYGYVDLGNGYDLLDQKMLKKLKKRSPFLEIANLGDGWSFGTRILPYYLPGYLPSQSPFFIQKGFLRSRLELINCDRSPDRFERAACMFTGGVRIPILNRGSETWMSLTPMEIYSLNPALHVAYGNVLVGGLGMG